MIGFINFYNKTVKLESRVGFTIDFGGIAGWYCLHCGSRHIQSDEITELFDEWMKEEKEEG